MRPLRCLEAARELIALEVFWCQFNKAEDTCGKACQPSDVYAWKFSLDGAIDCVADGNVRLATEARKTLSLFHPNSIAYFNDHHTHAEVLAVLDKAIALERSR